MANRYVGPLATRFWEKVDKTDGCWLWLGAPNSEGYGHIAQGGKTHAAHRLSWTLTGHTLTPGMTLDHLCRNRICVRPDHLEEVTNVANILRGSGSPAQNARKTHCPYGHPLSGENLYVRVTGRRQCKACRRQQQRKAA